MNIAFLTVIEGVCLTVTLSAVEARHWGVLPPKLLHKTTERNLACGVIPLMDYIIGGSEHSFAGPFIAAISPSGKDFTRADLLVGSITSVQ